MMNANYRRHAYALAGAMLLGVSAAAQTPSPHAAPADHPMLPRDLEIELALNAAPKHLRDGATVLVLESTGYVRAREGTNAFTCVARRRGVHAVADALSHGREGQGDAVESESAHHVLWTGPDRRGHRRRPRLAGVHEQSGTRRDDHRPCRQQGARDDSERIANTDRARRARAGIQARAAVARSPLRIFMIIL